MSKQASKRGRHTPKRVILPALSWSPSTERLGWVYREADEPSEAKLNSAARALRKHSLTRIAGGYTVSLVLPERLANVHRQSPLRYPPSMKDLAQRLSESRLPSMDEPVDEARVLGIRSYHNFLGVHIDYPGLDEELDYLNYTVWKTLGIHHEKSSVTPGEAHIAIARGLVSNLAEINRVKAVLPKTLALTSVIFSDSTSRY